MVSSGATPELIHLAELRPVPVVMTLMGKGGCPSSHPLNLGAGGMHGARSANHALTQSDLILAAGARFSDRVTGDVADFAPNAKIIHIDIDPAEIGKILHADVPIVGDHADVPIVGDLPGVLRGIAEHLEKEGAAPGDDAWLVEIERLRARFPYYHPDVGDRPDEIVPEKVMEGLSARLDPARSIVTTEVRRAPRPATTRGSPRSSGFALVFPTIIPMWATVRTRSSPRRSWRASRRVSIPRDRS